MTTEEELEQCKKELAECREALTMHKTWHVNLTRANEALQKKVDKMHPSTDKGLQERVKKAENESAYLVAVVKAIYRLSAQATGRYNNDEEDT